MNPQLQAVLQQAIQAFRVGNFNGAKSKRIDRGDAEWSLGEAFGGISSRFGNSPVGEDLSTKGI